MEELLLSRHMVYPIMVASQGNVILLLSLPMKPNSSWDIRRSSPKTAGPRNASGTSNCVPSVLYTAQQALLATDEHDVPHSPSVSLAVLMTTR